MKKNKNSPRWKKIWNTWQRIGKVIGTFQMQIILGLFYFTLLFVVGFLLKTLSDPLEIKKKSKQSGFKKWEHDTPDLETARKQY